jgi:signal transduction histidine kinase/CheY-like chemotaxis protein
LSRKGKILVIDDEQGIRDLLSYELSADGYTVETAADGEEGISKIKKGGFNIVITDIKMPRADGLHVLAEIKKIDSSIEVIMATGYGTIETAVESMKKGAYDYITKPFNMEEILLILEKALEKRELKALIGVYEASKAIFSELKIERIIEIILDLAAKTLNADDASIMLFDENQNLYVAGAAGIRGDKKRDARLALGERVAGEVASTHQPKILNGPLSRHPQFSGIDGIQEINSAIVCPIVTKKKTWGVLNANRIRIAEQFTSSDLNLAVVFVAQIGQAIENSFLYETLEKKVQLLQEAYKHLEETKERLVQSEKLAAIGELVAGVSHELNNPLAAVISYADLFQEADCDPELKHALSRIKFNAERCRRIVQNLLQFARRRKPTKRSLEVNAVVTQSLELLEYELKASSVEVVKRLADNLPPILADEQQLLQVFVNIINNAWYALSQKEGGRSLTVSTECAGSSIVIKLSDTGIGIEKENLSKIFDPFFTTKGVGKGTGLGLSISYGIVKEHDGEITVESEPGQGATFIIKLPITASV